MDKIANLPEGTRIILLAPLWYADAKAHIKPSSTRSRAAAFTHARVDGTVHSLDNEDELDRYKQHTIEAVVDRMIISQQGTKEDKRAALTRLTITVKTALKSG